MALAIAQVQTADKDVNQLQQNLILSLTPVLQNPIVSGLLIKSVALAAGSNAVNHKLGRPLIGWFMTRQRASASVYDNQDANQNNSVTLLLVASAPIVVDLFVF